MYRHEQSLPEQPWSYNDHARRYFVAKVRYTTREIPLKSWNFVASCAFVSASVTRITNDKLSHRRIILPIISFWVLLHNIQIEVKGLFAIFTVLRNFNLQHNSLESFSHTERQIRWLNKIYIKDTYFHLKLN